MARVFLPARAEPGFRDDGALPLGAVLELLGLIWAVDHALQGLSKRMFTTLGITGPQRLVLRIVGRFPGIPAGEVAAVLRLHPSTVTGVLKRLERRGLLRRRQDPRDGRRVLLGLSARGRRMDVVQSGTVEEAVRRVLDEVPARDVAGARLVLERLVATLETGAAGLGRGRRPR